MIRRVCFEVDRPFVMERAKEHPCEACYHYQSVRIRGRAFLVEDHEEQMVALNALMRKYQPEAGCAEYRKDKFRITGVVCIENQEMTGKQDLGKERARL